MLSSILILIVDPDENHRETLINDLRTRDYIVAGSADSDEALAFLDDMAPDLVVMDRNVKDLTPRQLLNEFQERDLDTFAIIMSDNSALDRIMDWVMDGAFAVLEKPIDPDRLVTVIENGMANKAAYHQVVTMAQELSLTNQALEMEKAALRKKSEELRFLYDLGVALSATLEAEKIITAASNAVNHLVNADLVTFVTNFPSDGEFLFYSNRTLSRNLVDDLSRDLLPLPVDESNSQSRIRVVHPRNQSRPFISQPDYQTFIPMITAGEVTGRMGLYFFDAPQIEPQTRMLLDSVALQTIQALFNAHQHEKVLEKAAHDPLTGLFNRRAFDEHLKRELERTVRYGTETSLIMLDLDHFKAVNDEFGHDVGDEVLQHVACVIDRSVRFSDIPSRYGGEEFAVLLPNTRQSEAVLLARRIRHEINESRLTFSDRQITLTISQGISDTQNARISKARDLVRMADKALYLAKFEGRDCIRLASDLNTGAKGKENLYACSR